MCAKIISKTCRRGAQSVQIRLYSLNNVHMWYFCCCRYCRLDLNLRREITQFGYKRKMFVLLIPISIFPMGVSNFFMINTYQDGA